MKILAANLKLFYQCRGLWIWELFILLWITISLFINSPEFYTGLFAVSLLAGAGTAGLQTDIISKPFSFCMPKNRRVLKHFILSTGSILNIVIGMAFIRYQGAEFPNVLLGFLAAGSVGMTFYLLAVWLTFSFGNTGRGGFVWFLLMALFWYGRPVEYIIYSFPFCPIIVGILASAIAWKRLANESVARKLCGTSLLGVADYWNSAKIRKYGQRRTVERLSRRPSLDSGRPEELFLSTFKACSLSSRNRFVLGNLYVTFGRSFLGTRWIWVTLPALLVASCAYFGYFAGMEISNPSYFNFSDLLFLSPVIGAVALDLTPYRSILLPSGRTEKYYSAIVVGFIVTILSTFLVAMIAVVTIPLSHIMPDITWKGDTFCFYVVDARKSYLTLIVVPIALALGTLFYNKRVSFLASVGIITLSAMAISVGFIFRAKLISLLPFGTPVVLGLIVASWLAFVLLLRYHCRKRDLVSQGR